MTNCNSGHRNVKSNNYNNYINEACEGLYMHHRQLQQRVSH